MNGHNFHQFNPNSCKQYLSPFGKNVLDTLIKHWRTGHNNENRRRQQLDCEPNKKKTSITEFRDSRDSSRLVTSVPSTPDSTNRGNEIYQAPTYENFPVPPRRTIPAKRQTLTFFKETLPNVPVNLSLIDPMGHSNNDLPSAAIPSSVELIKTVNIGNTNDNMDDEILTTNDVIAPAVEFSKKTYDCISNKKYNDDTNIPPVKFLENLNRESNAASKDEDIKTGEKNIERKDVDWGDMFDTELFSELKDSAPARKPEKKDKNNTFLIQFPNDRKKNIKDIKVPSTSSVNLIKSTDKKTDKRKNQTKITDSVTKKVKKSKQTVQQLKTDNIPKTSIRKVNYTTAVKNWLDDVSANNLVAEEKIDSDNVVVAAEKKDKLPKTESVDKLDDVITNITKEITKKTKEKPKKVVQARLAQRDGKMKFGMPTKEQNENKSEPVDEETKSKDTVKEKKAKPKFVAPIKSQIPVKNVTFDVSVIDDNTQNFMNNMLDTEVNEIAVVLVYTNGFSQLNNHHTEDTCIPEGIMIQLNDSYSYLRGENNNYGNIMTNLVQKFHVICYNAKQLLIHLESKFNIEFKQGSFNISDAKIGGSLIDPDNPPENFAELQKLLGFTPEFTIATECALQKAAWYITLLRECFARLRSLLIENSVWNVFVDIEMRLLPVIAGMECRGVSVDLEKLKSMEDILLAKMKAVEQECYKAAGKTFQINSTLQVRTILYDELQLDTKSNLKIKETIGKGAKSTSETMLRGLVSVHPLPKLILEYRHLHKAHATFLSGIAQHVKDGVVKPTWVQTAAATGRIASNNPNLQAIPKAPFSLEMFPNGDEAQEPPLNFRSVYGARAGRSLLAADFKHIECRVFAHAAQDGVLLAALRGGRDLFRVLAAKWLSKPEAEVSGEDRERTKRIVYASLYGAGARKLMDILQVGYEQALAVSSSFNRTFPALKAFERSVVARAARGALRSLGGRARRLRHLAGAAPARRAQAERQAVNFVVQGSAADLCKLAMARVERRLQARRPRVRARLVLQIHDELVWEVLDDDLHGAAAIIKDVMENVGRQCGMDMTLPVEMSCGQNWGEMVEYLPSEIESQDITIT